MMQLEMITSAGCYSGCGLWKGFVELPAMAQESVTDNVCPLRLAWAPTARVGRSLLA